MLFDALDTDRTIAIGARQHTLEQAVHLIDLFIAEPFSDEERHRRRIAQLAEYEATGAISGRTIDPSDATGATAAASDAASPSTAVGDPAPAADAAPDSTTGV